jgi:hypothetical protein
MQLVKFLKDHGGYVAGSYQWYDERIADSLVANKIGEIYVEPKAEVVTITEPEPEKQVEAPKKDKMVRSPRKKKAVAKPTDTMRWRK